MPPSTGSTARKAISEAIAEYQDKTCIHLVPRTRERDYVMFYRGNGWVSCACRCNKLIVLEAFVMHLDSVKQEDSVKIQKICPHAQHSVRNKELLAINPL